MTEPGTPPNRWRLLRWFVSSGTLNVPQAGGPIAFSLVALSLTGDTSGGAAMMLAMTLAQVVGVIPIARLGKRLPMAAYLRILVAIRTVALVGIALLAAYKAPFAWLIVLAAVGGLINGAAFGYLRAVLNHLTPQQRLPRALGISATLNELTFVLAPVAASGLGTVSPAFAVLVLATVGLLPAILIPNTGAAPAPDMRGVDVKSAGGSLFRPALLLWFVCATAQGATVASIEIGAVALALNFGHEPALAILFTVPLCLASVASGIWVSVRNRMPSSRTVLIQLCVMTVGSGLTTINLSAVTTVIGTLLIGSVLSPLSTYYSLKLDSLAPPQRRPEVFALLRTFNAGGVIVASAVLATVSISLALIVVTCMMIAVTLMVAIASLRGQTPPPIPPPQQESRR